MRLLHVVQFPHHGVRTLTKLFPSLNGRTLTKQTLCLCHVPFVQCTTDSTPGTVRDNGCSEPIKTFLHGMPFTWSVHEKFELTRIRTRQAGKIGHIRILGIGLELGCNGEGEERLSRISLTCKLVPVRYRENEYGLLYCPNVKLRSDVSFSCICPVTDDEFCHNIVKVAMDSRGDRRVDPQTTLTMI